MSNDAWARKRTVRLITRGRKSGQDRTVTLWFVPAGPKSIFVQHASSKPAHWYQNLRRDSQVRIDFGSGALSGRATPLENPQQIAKILELVRQKYWAARLIQFLGRKTTPLAAEIAFDV